MSAGDRIKLAVLTRRWTWFGELVLRLLAERGVEPDLIGVETTTLHARMRLARGLARHIGWIDAARYNVGFWWPVMRRRLGLDRRTAFPYANYGKRVIETEDINAPRIAQGIVERGIDRVLLAHSGIIRQRALLTPDIWVINAHPGALPRMRGVDVVRWSILEGVEPAVTVHRVDGGVDTGPILCRARVPPLPTEPLCAFEKRVNETAAHMLVQCGLAGREAFPRPERQEGQHGRQYHLMPFKRFPEVVERFEAMKQQQRYNVEA